MIAPNLDMILFRYDEVHPSERTCEYVADEFISLLEGKSQYGVSYH